jgi:hypothetical protein
MDRSRPKAVLGISSRPVSSLPLESTPPWIASEMMPESGGGYRTSAPRGFPPSAGFLEAFGTGHLLVTGPVSAYSSMLRLSACRATWRTARAGMTSASQCTEQ